MIKDIFKEEEDNCPSDIVIYSPAPSFQIQSTDGVTTQVYRVGDKVYIKVSYPLDIDQMTMEYELTTHSVRGVVSYETEGVPK